MLQITFMLFISSLKTIVFRAKTNSSGCYMGPLIMGHPVLNKMGKKGNSTFECKSLVAWPYGAYDLAACE